MMQGIMWIILGGTIGLAALVDARRGSHRQPDLRAPITIDGITLRLPAGWRMRDSDESQFPLTAIDDAFGRMLTVDVETIGIGEIFGMSIDRRRGRSTTRGEVPLGSVKVPLVLRQLRDDETDEQFSEFAATRRLAPTRRITVTLLTATTSRPQLAIEETLFRRLVSEIHIQNDIPPASTAPATTQSE
jgi:hypothetical protein